MFLLWRGVFWGSVLVFGGVGIRNIRFSNGFLQSANVAKLWISRQDFETPGFSIFCEMQGSHQSWSEFCWNYVEARIPSFLRSKTVEAYETVVQAGTSIWDDGSLWRRTWRLWFGLKTQERDNNGENSSARVGCSRGSLLEGKFYEKNNAQVDEI